MSILWISMYLKASLFSRVITSCLATSTVLSSLSAIRLDRTSNGVTNQSFKSALSTKYADNLIVEGRLSAYFVDNADLKVWLVTPFDVRSERISDREDKSVDVAKQEIITREKSEALRYMEIHNIDISNMDIYDIIINTGTFNPENVSEIIIQTLKVI